MQKSVALIIPVYNGGNLFRECLEAISQQSVSIARKIVIDSSSSDGSAALARAFDFEVVTITKAAFDHGGTRNKGLRLAEEEIVIYMTQDAVLSEPNSIDKLMRVFSKQEVAAAYGRQLPHIGADPLASFGRNTNYPSEGYTTDLSSSEPRGFMKCFMSNAFAAYRREALLSIGGFPEGQIFGEDAVATAWLLKKGYQVCYVPDAQARHSHNYTIIQEFNRYFDIGVFHTAHSWMLRDFGSVSQKGAQFAMQQFFTVFRKHGLKWALLSVFSSAAKYLGYKLGRKSQILGKALSRRLAMQKNYFSRNSANGRHGDIR